MKIYLDASVINIFLFGKHSNVEKDRFPKVEQLFKLINSHKINSLVSIYTLQEIYTFCKKLFPPEDIGRIAKNTLQTLFNNEFEISGLLSRNERLLHRSEFNLDDLSDQPHAISAFLNKCDCIVTYDFHFQKIKDKIPVYSPDEILLQFTNDNM